MTAIAAAELREKYPGVPWEKPLIVRVPQLMVDRLCCRYCIAIDGLKGLQVGERGFRTEDEFEAHVKSAHPTPTNTRSQPSQKFPGRWEIWHSYDGGHSWTMVGERDS